MNTSLKCSASRRPAATPRPPGAQAGGRRQRPERPGRWRCGAAPLLDIPSQLLRDQCVPALEQLHLQALEDRAEAWLRTERPNLDAA